MMLWQAMQKHNLVALHPFIAKIFSKNKILMQVHEYMYNSTVN